MIKKFVSCLACVSMFTMSAISVSADEITISPDICANFTVVGESNESIDNANISLIDASGKVVASWKGNDTTSTSSDYKQKSSLSKKIFNYVDVPGVDNEIIRKIRLGDFLIIDSADDIYSYEYGKKYDASVCYSIVGEETITVPANKMLINADSKLSNKSKQVGIGINSTNDISSRTVYNFNDIAGQEVMYDLNAGDYYAYICIGSGASSGGKVKTSSEPKTYVKATINLHEIDSHNFNADGTGNRGEDVFDFGVDADGKSAALYLISGSVVNAVIPDENSNVEVYLDSSTLYYNYSTNFSSNNSIGGGTNGVSLNYTNVYRTTITASPLPESGVNIIDIAPGEYTLRQENTVDGYKKPMDVKIKINNTSEVQTFKIVNEKAEPVTEATTTTAVTTITTSATTANNTTSTAPTESTTVTTTTSNATTSSTVAATTTMTTTKTTTSTTKAKENNSPNTGDKGIAGFVLAMAASACAIFAKRKSK